MFNVAARLAALRRKVLMVDVDLEAPGLSIGLLDEKTRRKKEGFAEIATALLRDLKIAFDANEDAEYFDALLDDFRARVQRALHEIDPLPMSPKKQELAQRFQEQFDFFTEPTGALSLLSTGRIRKDYTQQVAQLPLSGAYNDPLDAPMQAVVSSLVDDFVTPVDLERLSTRGHVFAAFVRELLHTAHVPDRDESFDHVLIDARSGLADVGGLCLIGLADARVVLTGLNEQNITGTEMVLDYVTGVDPHARDEDRLIVVFSPVPEGEVRLLEDRLSDAKETLDVDAEQTHLLHYHPRIALTEDPFAEPIHEHTRIYDEYEALTDRLLALTQSDARTLVDDALDSFRESDSDEEDGDDVNRYEQLVSELIPAAFLDADHVESVVDGLCSQMERSGPYEPEALALFDLWTALSPDEIRVLSTTANYYSETGRKNAPELDPDRIEILFQRGFDLYERAAETNPENAKIWYNWGTQLSRFAELVSSPDRAKLLYSNAADKFERTADIQPGNHQVWHNWGTNLGNLARLVQSDEPDRAEDLYLGAFDKFERAVDINPDKHEAWFNWGNNLSKLARLVQHDEPDRAEDLFLDAFDKFERAIDTEPEDYEAWGNWGINLVRKSRLSRSSGDAPQAITALGEAIHKLRRSMAHGGGVLPAFWLVIAHAERGQDEDIEAAAKLLKSALDEDPEFAVWFEQENEAAVREHPELRAILDRYREQIDADAVEDIDDLDAELDAMD
jgi:tetratricopeptide (TPR) repeat protein